jgi:hypothetical protein
MEEIMVPFAEQPQHLGGVGYFNKLPVRTISEDGSTWTVDNTKGFFAFVQLIPDIDEQEELGSDGEMHRRCDSGQSQYGPKAFHLWDEQSQKCNCGADTPPYSLTGNHDLPFNELTYLGTVFGNPECGGMVIYIESSDTEAENRVVAGRHSAGTRTIQELLRLMMEWEVAGSDFGSTEPMVDVCRNMLAGLEMPDDVRDWIWTNVPPNKVQKYLEGKTDAQTAEAPPDISGTIVEEWLLPLMQKTALIGFMPTGA